jgi:hypothetical protein
MLGPAFQTTPAMISSDNPEEPAHPVGMLAGPTSFANWRMLDSGVPPRDTLEYPLYTDAHITGESSFGPYHLLNSVAGDDHEGRVPALFLRATFAELPIPDMAATKDDTHHGGTFENELAALVSLAFGVRMYAGSATRFFREGGDPKGRPWSFHLGHTTQPVLLRKSRGPYVLPNVRGERNIDSSDLLPRFHGLTTKDAIAVVRVARLYQDAVWLAESQPALSWLLLVSAVESAADNWQPRDDAPATKLRGWKPDLAHTLESSCDPSLLNVVAEAVVSVTGATSKFVRFLLNLAPDAPEKRPHAHEQIAWDRRHRRDLYSKIYSCRSDALHSGKPFPTPMCFPPPPSGGAWAERPTGTAHSIDYSVWRSEDAPILLNTFEFMARQAIHNWWRSRLPSVRDDSSRASSDQS